MATTAPWLFGSVHPLPMLLLVAGLALILLLWALRLVVDGEPLWRPCGVGIGVALLCMLGICQIMPLSPGMLRTLSPATMELHEQLVPAEHEQPHRFSVGPAPALTLSVAPFATRQAVFQLIAVLALLAAVRSNLRSPGTLRRFAVVMTVNGVLLSLLGLAQFFTSPHNVLYWQFASEGSVFGPFICRNHFAYQMNLSMGLGFGLLLSARPQANGDAISFASSARSLLQQPAVLWIASALTLMGAGLVCSLSRGGIVAFFCAGLICLFVKLAHSHWTLRVRAGLVLAGLAAVGIAWLTSDFAGKRFATLWQTNVLEEGRGPVWSRVLELVPRFSIFGTGLGTFRFVEPLTRRYGDAGGVDYEYMHNDFLETLIEGGVIEFCIGLTIVVLLVRAGIRAHARLADGRARSLVLGSLFALTAVLVHEIVDFGMHIPALTLAVTITAALLLNVAESGASPAVARRAGGGRKRIASIAVGGVLACVAFFLVESAWRTERAERYRLAASRLPAADPKTADYLEAALAYTPNDPMLHVSAAGAYHAQFLTKQDRRWLSLAPPLACGGSANSLALLGPLANAVTLDDDLGMALSHHLAARNACPLLAEPQLFLAASRHGLINAEPATNYLMRACLLNPADAKSWYVAGLHELDAGERERAWVCWRNSLRCGRGYLPAILENVGKTLSMAELLGAVLPEEPAVQLEAAEQLQKAGASADAERIMTHALGLLQSREPDGGAPLVLKARLETRLRQFAAARQSYEKALQREPANLALRLEFGELLIQAGQLRDARRELVTILSLQPENQKVRSLHAALMRDLAEKEN